MSESFRIEPSGLYFAIYWGPTLICTEWTDREGAQLHCDILDALRLMDEAAAGYGDDRVAFLRIAATWAAFRDRRNRGRE